MPAASASKKRKASELDNSTESASKVKTPKKQSKKKRSSIASTDEIPFRPHCPVNANTKYRTKDVFVENKEIVPGFACDYAVEPGSRWKGMRSYRNVKYSEHTFTIGDLVYINNKSPPPPPPPENASDAEILAYDRTNFWVARIADTRAESDKAVYLRVFWLYWPEELPMGRQSYHSDRELIMSNAMEIVDAQTIASAASVTYWDENDMNAVWGERFWRQRLDIGKLGKGQKGGLSTLKKHCICHEPYNPDVIMYQCKDPACLTLNHEACLLDDISVRALKAYEDGTLDDLEIETSPAAERTIKSEPDHNKSSAGGLFSTLGKLVHAVADQTNLIKHEPTSPHSNNNNIDKNGASVVSPSLSPSKQTSTPQNKKSRIPLRPKSDPPDDNGISSPNSNSITTKIVSHAKGKLHISLVELDHLADDGPIVARVSDFRSTKKSKKSSASIPDTSISEVKTNDVWTIPVLCLVCKKSM